MSPSICWRHDGPESHQGLHGTESGGTTSKQNKQKQKQTQKSTAVAKNASSSSSSLLSKSKSNLLQSLYKYHAATAPATATSKDRLVSLRRSSVTTTTVNSDERIGIDVEMGGVITGDDENTSDDNDNYHQSNKNKKPSRSQVLGLEEDTYHNNNAADRSDDCLQPDHHPDQNHANKQASDQEQVNKDIDRLFSLPDLDSNKKPPKNGGNKDWKDDNDNHTGDDQSVTSVASTASMHRRYFTSRTALIAFLILVVGSGAAAIILGAGISAAQREQKSQFDRMSSDLLNTFETAVGDYVKAGLWIHQAAFQQRDTITHDEFRVAYEYVRSTGLELQALCFVMNVTSQEERAAMENRTRAYLQRDRPYVNYTGIIGYNAPGEPARPRDVHPYYYVAHFCEPMENTKNLGALDFDINTSPQRRVAVEMALRTQQPALTERLKLLKENEVGTEAYAYTTIIMHPGIPLSNATAASARRGRPRDVALTVIRIPEILIRARDNLHMKQHASLFLFDSTDKSDDDPPFLGGGLFHSDEQVESQTTGGKTITFSNELNLTDLEAGSYRYIHERRIPIASREWTFVVVAHNDTFIPNVTFIALGSAMIFFACVLLALWVVNNQRRMVKLNSIRAEAAAEKANIMVENAREAVKTERELNDFLSHEVRNPIAAAISACSFVQSSIQESYNQSLNNGGGDHKYNIVIDRDDFHCIQDDMSIIDSSLQFVNDLLRNMLDMHRASSNQMKIDFAPVDLLRDVLEPVASILYQRGSDFQVLIDCPENLIVMTDKLRLKQCALNLGRNSVKFVHRGFVRLRADVRDGKVHLYIEDSGPGIPQEKRSHLFGKFQETLDSLSQGTGMGLCLCKKLVELMGGDLVLDESYDSGVEDFPGACFVINMNTPPLSIDQIAEEYLHESVPVETISIYKEEESGSNERRLIPENLSVLFVDDDWKLRTLFSRALSRVTKGWTIREAANGETALKLAGEQHFDIIFMDQYMSSVVKQLLGSETVHALRSRGVTSIICGLSANDVEASFLGAGANFFVMKPLPTEKEELTQVLFQILDSANTRFASKPIKPLSFPSRNPMPMNRSQSGGSKSTKSSKSDESFHLADALPQNLSVLFVDDDDKLRQLYCRSLRRAAPGCTIGEAPDGETALEMVEQQRYDLIFLDQYMPKKHGKSMLGSETAWAMRAKGVKAVICGLSANNVKATFLQAGADFFYMKPFPCEKEAIVRELVRMLGTAPVKQGQNESFRNDSGPCSKPEAPKLSLQHQNHEIAMAPPQGPNADEYDEEPLPRLPEHLSVLFVDDSPVLRKMFIRSVRRATQDWIIHEAESGESALEMIESDPTEYDLIFLDQHMSTTMLGTDTARALRQKGVTSSIICGLSGDDIESTFLDAGADAFMMKPFQCEKIPLVKDLARVLSSRSSKQTSNDVSTTNNPPSSTSSSTPIFYCSTATTA